MFKLPGTLQGTLTEPGETHRARFHVDAPADIAIEVEAPAAAPPFFNPIVRLLNQSGEEVATNVFANLGACSGALIEIDASEDYRATAGHGRLHGGDSRCNLGSSVDRSFNIACRFGRRFRTSVKLRSAAMS